MKEKFYSLKTTFLGKKSFYEETTMEFDYKENKKKFVDEDVFFFIYNTENYYGRFFVGGKQVSISSKTTNKKKAIKILEQYYEDNDIIVKITLPKRMQDQVAAYTIQ